MGMFSRATKVVPDPRPGRRRARAMSGRGEPAGGGRAFRHNVGDNNICKHSNKSADNITISKHDQQLIKTITVKTH